MTSEARLFVNIAVIGLGEGLMLGACIFAWIKGRAAERYGAALYFFSCVVALVMEFVVGTELPLTELLFDGFVAAGFLILAIRYNSLWLGAAMMIKGVQLAMHATHLTDADDPHFAGLNLYAVALDLINLLISFTIIGGTLASMRSRREASVRQALNTSVASGGAASLAIEP
jgi:hypothetical protein